ncbi:unnamed protein product [Bursaphelenchus xylophilus]|uniref:(pine wood nematode) hypothetical protein n=1 Tax=Bursaphelenchus xylophilus TaxID=6326 RepID=A0A1I7STP9_BURXY|nr:unnamed protein product [Bursaphelenchus xylophilus]CAG9108129.1 unnamed protein product [Bursaphelenchus xylophilus]
MWIPIHIFFFVVSSVISQKTSKQVVVTSSDEKRRDPEGFAAIRELHSLLDDDKSGSIDRSESADFLKEDLKVMGTDKTVRENAFHHKTDESVTVDDLWDSWFDSPEREWTTSEMVSWLTNVVRLPQYAEHFVNAKLTGIAFPRMAVPNNSYIVEVLKIKNSVHRQKLQLKALDVVLFGVHDSTSLKDVALAILAASFIVLAVVFISHRNKSHKQLEELSTQLSELNTMERNFGAENNEDLEQLQSKLREMEQQLDARSNYDPSSVLSDLQPLLRITYEKELCYIHFTKARCLEEMKEAREYVDKLRKKQTNLFNSIKLATGATSGTDSIDFKIFKLKERMEKIRTDFTELHNRYAQMENIMGMQIMGPTDSPYEHPAMTTNASSSYLPSLISQGSF